MILITPTVVIWQPLARGVVRMTAPSAPGVWALVDGKTAMLLTDDESASDPVVRRTEATDHYTALRVAHGWMRDEALRKLVSEN